MIATCTTCDHSRSWHRRQAEWLERTIGPSAGLDFEARHPEEEWPGQLEGADAPAGWCDQHNRMACPLHDVEPGLNEVEEVLGISVDRLLDRTNDGQIVGQTWMERDDREELPVHTIGHRPIGPDNPGAYGRTHDRDCPGCQDTPFLASPRSETYWSS